MNNPFEPTDFSWDPRNEKYEDFLERIPDDLRQELAEDRAMLVKPWDAWPIFERFHDLAEKYPDDDDAAEAEWKAWLESLTDEDDLKEKIVLMHSLSIPALFVIKSLTKRLRDVHIENCPKCQEKQKGRDKQTKAIDAALRAAKEAFDAALEEDDWEESIEDPDAWKSGGDE